MLRRVPLTILGVGSIGSLFATKLVLAGNKVTVLARKEHAHQIATGGLTLQDCQGEIQHVSIDAKSQLDANMLEHHVIIATKAYDNEAVCDLINDVLTPQAKQRTKVILLQNGVGNEKPYEQIFLQQNLYRLLTSEAATLVNPGQVVHTGRGQTVLVRRDSGSGSYGTWLAGVLTDSELPCRMSTNFSESIWTKLLINASINPLGAIYQVKNGQLLRQKKILRRFKKLVMESIQILEAKPINTSFKNPHEEIKEVVRKTANNKSSMLQDLERGKPTEIDYINGVIVMLARELEMDAKENIHTVRQVKALEQLNREIGSRFTIPRQNTK